MKTRPVRIALSASLLALTLASAHAQAPAPKPPDVQTIGGVTSVITTTPVVVAPSPVAPAPTARAPLATTPEPAQLARLADLLRETAAQIAPLAPTEGKLANFSSSAPDRLPEAGAIAPPPAPRGHQVADVLGPLPRPEWSTGLPVKSAAHLTIGPPTGIDHAIPPAPAAKVAVRRAREPDFGTSRPRDPALPPPSPVKPGPGAPRPEDRP